MKAELRGARLFVKRGEHEFSTGMLGHLKLLAHKTESAERLGQSCRFPLPAIRRLISRRSLQARARLEGVYERRAPSHDPLFLR